VITRATAPYCTCVVCQDYGECDLARERPIWTFANVMDEMRTA
jgi:hypothetical protein